MRKQKTPASTLRQQENRRGTETAGGEKRTLTLRRAVETAHLLHRLLKISTRRCISSRQTFKAKGGMVWPQALTPLVPHKVRLPDGSARLPPLPSFEQPPSPLLWTHAATQVLPTLQGQARLLGPCYTISPRVRNRLLGGTDQPSTLTPAQDGSGEAPSKTWVTRKKAWCLPLTPGLRTALTYAGRWLETSFH